MIPVTRPYFPNIRKVEAYLEGIYSRQRLTNGGPLVEELATRLEAYLGVRNLVLVANGTLALQIAYRVLGISGRLEGQADAVTTPFSFIATASSLKWEGVQPRFADIQRGGWCLDPAAIATTISDSTRAIVPVHVFGNACAVDEIDDIASQYGLKVVYDGAHAFGVRYAGKSLLAHGDATTLSFHATKVFHSVEGGAIVFRDAELARRARRMINFGIDEQGKLSDLGINAKMNEVQAAMGLAVLDELERNLQGRAEAWAVYHERLKDAVTLQYRHPECSNNFGYFPVVLESEAKLLAVLEHLTEQGVGARRYFHPALSRVSCLREATAHVHGSETPNADSLAERVLCLPLYLGVPAQQVANEFLAALRTPVRQRAWPTPTPMTENLWPGSMQP
ncbi:DegT/DnrJ/EryC1/StrS family aminotransferase [Halomonas mongoliensis]|uniref:DegT/DnrJ/EryC1/StrS family aminotransferase n=1 Tax=Halomonas mongoliensis TaxID=321265 RepID=UPI00403AAE9A